jgi:hypothetical protein
MKIVFYKRLFVWKYGFGCLQKAFLEFLEKIEISLLGFTT